MAGIPLGLKLLQVNLGLLNRWGLVDGFQVGCNLFALLPRNVVQAVAHHMDDAELNLGVRKDGLDGFGKTLEPIDTSDEDIFHAPVLQFVYNLQPELGSLGLGGSHAENLLDAFEVDANGQINGFIDDSS